MAANLSTAMVVQMRKKFEERNQHIRAKLGSEVGLSLQSHPLPALMTLPDLGYCFLSSGSLVSQVESPCSLRDLGEIMWAEWAEVLRKPALLQMFVFVTSERQTQGHSQRIRWQS